MIDSMTDTMTGRRVFISGATSGIGRETAFALAAMGARLILACRNKDKMDALIGELKALRSGAGEGDFQGVLVDFSSLASVRSCAAETARLTGSIDVLINNAGAFFPRRGETEDGLERTFEVNYLGHFLLTHLLLPLVKAGDRPRIINTGSDSHYYGKLDLDDLNYRRRRYSGFKAYAASRLATMMFTLELAGRLETDPAGLGVTVNCGHPGHVDTNIWQFGDEASFVDRLAAKVQRRFSITPEEGARCIVYLASSRKVEGVTGGYFAADRGKETAEKAPAKKALNPAIRKALWEKSLKLTGL